MDIPVCPSKLRLHSVGSKMGKIRWARQGSRRSVGRSAGCSAWPCIDPRPRRSWATPITQRRPITNSNAGQVTSKAGIRWVGEQQSAPGLEVDASEAGSGVPVLLCSPRWPPRPAQSSSQHQSGSLETYSTPHYIQHPLVCTWAVHQRRRTFSCANPALVIRPSETRSWPCDPCDGPAREFGSDGGQTSSRAPTPGTRWADAWWPMSEGEEGSSPLGIQYSGRAARLAGVGSNRERALSLSHSRESTLIAVEPRAGGRAKMDTAGSGTGGMRCKWSHDEHDEHDDQHCDPAQWDSGQHCFRWWVGRGMSGAPCSVLPMDLLAWAIDLCAIFSPSAYPTRPSRG
nr:hypothetical protein CFP56_21729 [Quercus suber]